MSTKKVVFSCFNVVQVVCHLTPAHAASIQAEAQQGHCGADDGVEYPEEVGGAVLMDDHVATDLSPVEAVVPDFYGRYNLEGDDVENEDV